jgi:hypothetical protein
MLIRKTLSKIGGSIFMREAEIVRLVFLIMGAFDLMLGFLIKKFELADLVSGYNPKKHDKKKTADIVGSNFMLMGLLMILLTVIYIVFPGLDLNIYIASELIIIAGLMIRMEYCTRRHDHLKR